MNDLPHLALQILQIVAGGWLACSLILFAALAVDHLRGRLGAAPLVWAVLVVGGPLTLLLGLSLFFAMREPDPAK